MMQDLICGFAVIAILCFNLSLQQINIDEYGAIPGVFTKAQALANGAAYAKAVSAANASSTLANRTVLIAGGKTYSMLPIQQELLDVKNVTIRLDGTLSAFTDNFTENWPGYPNSYNWIAFRRCSNVAIVGSGSLLGNGYEWWQFVIRNGSDHRPDLLVMSSCSNVAITGIRLENSPRFHITIDDMLGVRITNVTVHVDVDKQRDLLRQHGRLMETNSGISIPTFPLNTDGIDVAGRDILVTNVSITNFDDAVAVKPTHANHGSVFNLTCTQNVTISHSRVTYGVGMSIGSVPPNVNNNCIDGVNIYDVNFTTPIKAIYIKPNPGKEGTGTIANIAYRDINIHRALWWAIFIGTQQQHQPHSTGTGCSFLYPAFNTTCETDPLVSIRNITLQRVHIYDAVLSPGIIIANVSNPATGIVFDSVNVHGGGKWPVEGGNYLCSNVQGISTNSNPAPPCLSKH